MQIQIFTTGGTIDKVYFDAQSEYEVGDPQISEILETAGVTVPYAVETLMRKDSLDLTDADRAAIAERVRACDRSRIVITHGTDTMVETARSLGDPSAGSGQALAGKTVVFVGSLSPARFKGTDAEFNIGFAMAAVQTLPPGVYVAMNGRVFEAAKVHKNRQVNRFEGVAYHPSAPAS